MSDDAIREAAERILDWLTDNPVAFDANDLDHCIQIIHEELGDRARSDGPDQRQRQREQRVTNARKIQSCERCGGDYCVTGIESGCACLVLARAEKAETALFAAMIRETQTLQAEAERDEAIALLRGWVTVGDSFLGDTLMLLARLDAKVKP